MKTQLLDLAALLAALLVPNSAFAQDPATAARPVGLLGAGATLPAPLYKQWIGAYRKLEPQTTIEYNDVGSGEGTKRFLDGAVDFGASGAALTDEQITAARSGAVLVPATAGMVVLTYNLPGLKGPLKLSRDTYVALFLGRIPKWNDARIQATNPGLNLPDRDIVLVARQDSSGTTFVLTNHLSAVSQQLRNRGPGVGKLIGWPANTMLVQGQCGRGGAGEDQRWCGGLCRVRTLQAPGTAHGAPREQRRPLRGPGSGRRRGYAGRRI